MLEAASPSPAFHPHLPCPGAAGRKSASTGDSHAEKVIVMADPEAECAIQLRRIGDKLNFRQKLLNLISKLFRSGT
ncbi:phorbol-12-myristate-13-acetate-induced protein 1 [Camelus ferus]|nr:phorbol-12-myristate-13-acetate-induced protein 1 [Camelus ferus]